MPNRQIQRKADPNLVRDARSRIEALFGSPGTDFPVDSEPRDLAQWRTRRLESDYAMVFFDSLVVKVCERGLLRGARIHLALGILADGSKDIIGFWIEQAPASLSWPSAMSQLRARGVAGFGFAVAEDDRAVRAIRTGFASVQVFRSVKHLVHNSVECLQPPSRGPAAAHLLHLFVEGGPAVTFADLALFPLLRDNPAIAAYWRRNWTSVAPIISMPSTLRDVLCTTSAVESVTEKLRRRAVTKRSSFTSTAAAIRELLFVLQDAKASWKVAPQKWAAVRAELLTNQEAVAGNFA